MRAEDSQFLLWDHTCEQTPPIGSHFEQWLHADERVVLSLEMCGSAAPTIIARGIDQARSNRVQLDVPRCCQQVGFIEHEPSEASLPEVSPPALPKVDMASVSPMRLTNGQSKTVCRFWRSNQVNMIRHQTVGPNLDLLDTTKLGHQLQVARIVVLAEEGLLPAISTLGNYGGEGQEQPHEPGEP